MRLLIIKSKILKLYIKINSIKINLAKNTKVDIHKTLLIYTLKATLEECILRCALKAYFTPLKWFSSRIITTELMQRNMITTFIILLTILFLQSI